jgi:hypothetical protein
LSACQALGSFVLSLPESRVPFFLTNTRYFMMNFEMLRRTPSFFCVTSLLAFALHGVFSSPAWANDDEDKGKSHVRYEYYLHADLTNDELVTVDKQPVKAGKPLQNTSLHRDFSPATETLALQEAWVSEPDGSRHTVPPEDIFTRSAPQPADAPGFNARQRITVVFPRVGPSARVHIVWKVQHLVPQLFGFNLLEGALTQGKLDDMTVILHLPPNLPLKWYADPVVATTDVIENGERVITASFKAIPEMKIGYSTVDYKQFRPRFMATTLTSLDDMGNRIFNEAEKPKNSGGNAKSKTQIKTLADKITGDKTGLDAAAAIHDWIRENIAYVAVYLNPNDGWVEHPVDKILANGFGDCKDQVALMRALLAAKGIRAERVAVEWGRLFAPMPLPVAWQFNHVILYLPDFDVFDNPTDKTAAFGALGDHLTAKQALLIDHDSKVVQLPAQTSKTFWSKNHSVITLTAEGNVEGQAVVEVSSDEALHYKARINSRGRDNYLNSILAMNNQEGDGTLRMLEPKTWREPLALKAHWTSQNYVDVNDPDIYLPLESGFDPERVTQQAFNIRNDVRVAPLLLGAQGSEWQFEYDLPAGFTVKHLPAPVHLANTAGRFDSEVTAHGNQIVVKRSFVSNQVVYQPRDYPDLRVLLVAAVKAGHSHAILQRQKLGG